MCVYNGLFYCNIFCILFDVKILNIFLYMSRAAQGVCMCT